MSALIHGLAHLTGWNGCETYCWFTNEWVNHSLCIVLHTGYRCKGCGAIKEAYAVYTTQL